MINKEDCYLLGRIRKTTGFTGEVVIGIDYDLSELNPDLEFVHLEIEGSLIPFFIDKCDFSNAKSMKVSFIDVPSQEKAKKLLDCLVFIEKCQLANQKHTKVLQGIEGYSVWDETLGEIGKVDSILENPGQDLLVVIQDDKEILIPVADEIILAVDQKKRRILVDLPEGLLDLNE